MRVRHRAARVERIVEVESCLDGYTVNDLAAALASGPGADRPGAHRPDAGEGGKVMTPGLRIDGCWHAPETPLSSVRIWEGALLEIAPIVPNEQAPSQSTDPSGPAGRDGGVAAQPSAAASAVPSGSAGNSGEVAAAASAVLSGAAGRCPDRFLAVTAGLRAGTRLAVPAAEAWVIGRDNRCDLVLDDPAVSGRHARITVRGSDGRLSIVDLGSRNGTVVAGQAVRGPVVVPGGATVRLGATCLQWRATVDDTPAALRAGIGAAAGRIPFNRPPRRRPRMAPAPLRVPAEPPPKPEQEPLGWAGIVLPVVAGLALALVWSPFMAVFAALGPVIAVGTWLERRRRADRKHQQACRQVDEAVQRLVRTLPAVRAAERRRVVALLPDPAEIVRRTETLSVRCWERRLGDPDAMRLGAGVADVAFSPPVKIDGGGSAAPAALAALQAAGPLEDVPVAVSLQPGEVVGIVGTPEVARAVARALVLQAAVLHGPADLAVVGLAPGRADDWSWMRWLPHAADVFGGGTGALVATEPDTLAATAATAAADRSPRVKLALVDGTGPLTGRNAPARTVLDLPTAAGIVVAERSSDLPAACTTIVEVRHDGGGLRLVDPRSAAVLEPVIAWGVTVGTATDAAARLARLDDPDLSAANASLPDTVSLIDLTGEPTPDNMLRRWEASRGTADLKAPVGTAGDGPLELDLVADGPHLLVGGTTGSGKSELLRSLVAALAMSADPDHLAFVLVDYKGGAAFDRCSDMPHVAGMVTDLDDRLAERALVCLEAELRHREERLRSVGAEDLAAFRARCRGLPPGSPALEPLPRLVVVVDEFATLAAELPEFLDSLVGIAQRGRSLGVHMVLATQRPAGVVTEDIRANTTCRIALRVTDRHDSNDVIGAPDAARIPRRTPGRALARFGPGELIAFQSALVTGTTAPAAAGVRAKPITDWSPVPDTDGDAPAVHPAEADATPGDWSPVSDTGGDLSAACSADADAVLVDWSPVSDAGGDAWSDPGARSQPSAPDARAEPIGLAGLSSPPQQPADSPPPRPDGEERYGQAGYDQRDLSARTWPSPAGDERSDLDRVVAGVVAAHEHLGGRRPRSPWPAPLPGRIAADTLAETAPPGGPAAWLVDDPTGQRQFTGGWDIDDGHLVVLGGPGSGTSTTLAAVVLDLCRARTPDELHVYVVDLDAGLLSALEGLPHVGAAIPPADAERRSRVIRLVDEEVAARRAGGRPGARAEIVLIVDDFAGLARAHDPVRDTEPHERFARIWSDGPAVGVRAAVSIGRAADLPPDLAASAGTVLVHATSDASDGLRFGLRASTAGLAAGRAVRADDGREVQVGLPGIGLRGGEGGDGGDGCGLRGGDDGDGGGLRGGDDGDGGDSCGLRGGGLAAAVAATAARTAPASAGPALVGALPAVVEARRLPVGTQADERVIDIRFAMSDLTLEPCGFALHDGEHALVLGPPRTGRTAALAAIGAAARSAGVEVTVVADRPNDLSARLGAEPVSAQHISDKPCRTAHCGAGDDGVACGAGDDGVACGAGDDGTHFDKKDVSAERANARACGALHSQRRLLLVDDADRVEDPAGNLARIAASDGRCHIVAATTADRMRSCYGHWLAEMRASRTGVLFRPGPLDGDLLGAALPARLALAPLPGRGLIVADGTAAAAQVALVSPTA